MINTVNVQRRTTNLRRTLFRHTIMRLTFQTLKFNQHVIITIHRDRTAKRHHGRRRQNARPYGASDRSRAPQVRAFRVRSDFGLNTTSSKYRTTNRTNPSPMTIPTTIPRLTRPLPCSRPQYLIVIPTSFSIQWEVSTVSRCATFAIRLTSGVTRIRVGHPRGVGSVGTTF